MPLHGVFIARRRTTIDSASRPLFHPLGCVRVEDAAGAPARLRKEKRMVTFGRARCTCVKLSSTPLGLITFVSLLRDARPRCPSAMASSRTGWFRRELRPLIQVNHIRVSPRKNESAIFIFFIRTDFLTRMRSDNWFLLWSSCMKIINLFSKFFY